MIIVDIGLEKVIVERAKTTGLHGLLRLQSVDFFMDGVCNCRIGINKSSTLGLFFDD
jgi:hypothetical protein